MLQKVYDVGGDCATRVQVYSCLWQFKKLLKSELRRELRKASDKPQVLPAPAMLSFCDPDSHKMACFCDSLPSASLGVAFRRCFSELLHA